MAPTCALEVLKSHFKDEFNKEGDNVTELRYIKHLYCLVVFYSKVVKCLHSTRRPGSSLSWVHP